MDAVEARDLDEIRRRLEENRKAARYNPRSQLSYGPIQRAAMLNFCDVVELIDSIDPKALCQFTNNDFTILHYAVGDTGKDNWQVTQLICRLAPELMEIGEVLGRTPMHMALFKGNTQCALVMHKMGFDDYYDKPEFLESCVNMCSESKRGSLGRALARCRSLSEVMLLTFEVRPAPRVRKISGCILS